MVDQKYGKYIITDTPKNLSHSTQFNTLWIFNELDKKIKGAFYLDCSMVLKKDEESPDPLHNRSHSHDFDEYLVFIGTNPDDPTELCGEVELWLGNEEKHIITKSCAVFVPGGLFHTPLNFKRVDRPIIFVRAGNTLKDPRTLMHYSEIQQ